MPAGLRFHHHFFASFEVAAAARGGSAMRLDLR
jgi:hypothetical protein